MAPSLKSILALSLASISTVNAHAYFHKAFVNDIDQGQLFGVRAPSSNSPIQDVTSSTITCNAPLRQPVSQDVIEVAPGDKFGMQWNHAIDGPQGAGDADDPIAASHKGPIMAYMAKVDDAATDDGSGLAWFKVAEEGLDTTTGKWGVDTMIAANGLWSFTIPSLAPGDYLMRGEIIALHSAYGAGEAQFYMSCAAIKVTGSGTCSPSTTVSFPGAYKADDEGILISIYGNSGQPDNGGKSYVIPGPEVVSCDGSESAPASASSSKPTSAAASVSVSITATPSTDLAVISTSTPSTSIASTSTSKPTSADIPADIPADTIAHTAAPTSGPTSPSPPSTTLPISFSSTVTGRIGKPTKFVCYAESDEL